MPVHLHIVYGCFGAMTVKLRSLYKDRIAQKTLCIYYLHLYRNSLTTRDPNLASELELASETRPIAFGILALKNDQINE